MPNWCSNVLEVSGTAEDLKEFTDTARSVEHCEAHMDQLTQEIIPARTDHYEIRFNKLRPMPDEIRGIVSGGHTLPDGKYVHNWRESADGTCTEVPAEEIARLVRRFGASNWYDWQVGNWGVKWDVVHADSGRSDDGPVEGETQASYTFETAWSPPETLFHYVAEKFPKLTFTLTYYEEGMGFGGMLTWHRGKLVGHEETEEGCLRDWLAVKGIRSDVKLTCEKCQKESYDEDFVGTTCYDCAYAPNNVDEDPADAPS